MTSRRKIRVLVVDDSTFMRKALRRMLTSDPAIDVVGDAADGPSALSEILRLHPDVVTMDVRMPGMDGLTLLRKVMAQCPTPVLMVSAVTQEGGAVTLGALEAGAVDFIDKSACHTMMDILDIADDLVNKVKVLSRVDAHRLQRNIRHRATKPPAPRPVVEVSGPDSPPTHVVVIGASTGGPVALESIIRELPPPFAGAILVAQHMPEGFTRSLADRLDQHTPWRVCEAEQGEPIRSGGVYVAPSGYHLTLRFDDGSYRVRLSRDPKDTPHHPSVDVLFENVARTWEHKLLGIVLTGMGRDGEQGVKAIVAHGGRVVAQDEETCVVFGMPQVAQATGCVDELLPLSKMAVEIGRFAES